MRLFQADGGWSLWKGGRRIDQRARDGKAEFNALELPDDFVLRRVLTMPAMSTADIASAAGLQARAISPFVEQDLIWGYRSLLRSDGRCQVELVLASAKQIAQYLQEQVVRLGGAVPELWVMPGDGGAPTVLTGYGEGARYAKGLRGRWLRYALLVLALILASGIAVTPTFQLRARALEAIAAYEAAVRRTVPVVKEREAFMHSTERLGALSELLAGRIEPLRVLDRLTKVLPDDTALQSFTLKGQKVTINGLAFNASAVMQVLGEQSGVRDVRAPNPATRVGGANSKENFVIEFMVDPLEFGVATVQGSAVAVVSSTPPAVAAATAATPSVSVAASPNQPASAPASAKAEGGAGALMPVFGGSPAQTTLPPAKPASAKPQGKGTP